MLQSWKVKSNQSIVRGLFPWRKHELPKGISTQEDKNSYTEGPEIDWCRRCCLVLRFCSLVDIDMRNAGSDNLCYPLSVGGVLPLLVLASHAVRALRGEEPTAAFLASTVSGFVFPADGTAEAVHQT